MNISDLLATERTRPGFSTEARTAMWKGIEQSIGGAAVATAAATAATTTAAKIASWKIGAIAGVALAIGAGAGAVGHAKWGEAKVVYVQTAASPAIVTAEPTASAPIVNPPEISASALPSVATTALHPTASAKPAASASAAAPAKDPALARERTLLDMARTAMSRGDTSSALAAVDTHAREFPRSQLGEEREVIAIQTLAAAGRGAEARKRAAAFHANYPSSGLSSIVDEATQ